MNAEVVACCGMVPDILSNRLDREARCPDGETRWRSYMEKREARCEKREARSEPLPSRLPRFNCPLSLTREARAFVWLDTECDKSYDVQ